MSFWSLLSVDADSVSILYDFNLFTCGMIMIRGDEVNCY